MQTQPGCRSPRGRPLETIRWFQQPSSLPGSTNCKAAAHAYLTLSTQRLVYGIQTPQSQSSSLQVQGICMHASPHHSLL